MAGSGARPVGWKVLAPLVLVTAAGPVSMQMFLPALPDMAADLDVSAAVAQMTVSVPLLVFGLAMLVWGPLSDRFGRRPPLLAGVVLFILGNVICAIAPTIEVLVAGRIINAFGGAAGMVLTRAMVRDLETPDRVAAAMSLLTVGQVVPPLMAPALGGVLTDLVDWRANFTALVALGVIAGLAVARFPETHRPGAGHAVGSIGASLLGGFAVLLRLRAFRAHALFAAAATAAYFAFLGGAPLVAAVTLGLSPTVYGVAFASISASFLAGNLLAARISPRVGIPRMVMLGGSFALAGAGLGLGLALGGVWTAVALFGPTMLVAFGNGLSLNNAQAGAMAAEPRLAGAAAGLMGFLQMAVGAAAAQAVGLGFDGTPVPLLAIMAGAGVVALVAYGLGTRASVRPDSR